MPDLGKSQVLPGDAKDLIYEGIATLSSVVRRTTQTVFYDAKDLIYEGIATVSIIMIILLSIFNYRRQRPDLRRDCDCASSP